MRRLSRPRVKMLSIYDADGCVVYTLSALRTNADEAQVDGVIGAWQVIAVDFKNVQKVEGVRSERVRLVL